MRGKLRSVIHLLFNVMAIWLIIVAFCMSVTQLATPLLNHHKQTIEWQVSRQLGLPVHIQQVSFTWYGMSPGILASDIQLGDMTKSTNQPSLKIKKIRVSVALLASLWRRTWVINRLLISGLSLHVNQEATGLFKLQELPMLPGWQFNLQPSAHQLTKAQLSTMTAWMFAASAIRLDHLELSYTLYQKPLRKVSLTQARLVNGFINHWIYAKAVLHQAIPTTVDAALEWRGQGLEIATWHARLYLYITGLSLGDWLANQHWQGWTIRQGLGSAKCWAVWDQGVMQKIQTNFRLYELRLSKENQPAQQVVRRLSGDIGWRRDHGGQVIAGDNMLIDLPHHLWPITNFYFSYASDPVKGLVPKNAEIGYVNVGDLLPYVSTMFSPATAWPSILSALRIQGSLYNVAIVFPKDFSNFLDATFSADFSEWQWQSWHQLPSGTNFSGNIQWRNRIGDLVLNTTEASVRYDKLFLQPLPIVQLTGRIHAEPMQSPSDYLWQIKASDLHVVNNDIEVNAGGTIMVPQKALPTVDLKAAIKLAKVTHVTRYLPMRIFDHELAAWLQQAFLSGEVSEATAILRGPLADFPFEDNRQGQFLISSIAKNVDFSYAPDWPILRQVSGKVVFSGRQMIADVDGARLFNMPIGHVSGLIPYFGDAKPQVLTVNSSTISADLSQGLAYVRASPLQKTIGRMFAGMDLSGPMRLKLGLVIPLKKPEETKVTGTLILLNGNMQMLPWQLTVDHLQGEVQFTEKSTTAKQLRGEIFHKPLQLSLATLQKTVNAEPVSFVQAKFDTQVVMSDLAQWLKVPLNQYIEGATTVSGSIDFALDEPFVMQLNSNLLGVSLHLPPPFDKPATVAHDFSAELIVQDKQPMKVKFIEDHDARAAILLSRQANQYQLVAANVLIGKGDVLWPTTRALTISVDLDQLDWEQIQRAINGQSTTISLPNLPLTAINVHAGQLRMGSVMFQQINLAITPTPTYWNIVVSGQDAVGQLSVPKQSSGRAPLTAKFTHLSINANPNASKLGGFSFNPKSLPPLDLNIEKAVYHQMAFGHVEIQTTPTANGLQIQQMTVSSQDLNLTSQGLWEQSGRKMATYLKGQASSTSVNELLGHIGMDARNFVVNKGSLTFDLNWLDSPYQPDLATLNGRASLDLGPGRVVDLGKTSGAKMDIGRLLSIFSLQAMPGRLTSGFRDMFQKGYSFSSVRGDFTFQKGDAYTQNLRLEGPVAGVGINGVIGLSRQEFNLLLSVTPYVTSSMPVAATFLGGPWIGLAALAVNTVVSKTNNFTTYYYEVTGPWANPSWKAVSKSASQYKRSINE